MIRMNKEMKEMNEVINKVNRRVYGVGITDIPTIDENGNRLREYQIWKDMIRRCFSKNTESERRRHATYDGVKVCDRWLVFSKFLEDLPLIEGYALWKNQKGYELDKDKKQQGLENKDKIYSVETCCFITHEENVSIATKTRKCNPTRGSYVSFDIKNDFAFEIHHGLGEFQAKQSQICKCVNHVTKTSCGRKWYKLEEAQELLQILFEKAKQIDWYALSVEDYQQAYDMLRQGDWNELNEFYDEIFDKYGFERVETV